MANETKNIIQGVTGGITIDTEVTASGEYPVMSKGIYAAINGAISAIPKAENVALLEDTAKLADVIVAINAILEALQAAGLMEEPEAETLAES